MGAIPNKADITRAAALRRGGMSYSAIAATLGWSRVTARKWVRHALGATEAAAYGKRESAGEAACRLHAAGVSYAEIAVELGFADSRRAAAAVCKYRARRGMTVPRPGRSPRPAPVAEGPMPTEHTWHYLPESRTSLCAVCHLEVREPADVGWSCAEWRMESRQRRGRATVAGVREVG